MKEDIDKAEDIARKLSLELQGVPQEEIKTFSGGDLTKSQRACEGSLSL